MSSIHLVSTKHLDPPKHTRSGLGKWPEQQDELNPYPQLSQLSLLKSQTGRNERRFFETRFPLLHVYQEPSSDSSFGLGKSKFFCPIRTSQPRLLSKMKKIHHVFCCRRRTDARIAKPQLPDSIQTGSGASNYSDYPTEISDFFRNSGVSCSSMLNKPKTSKPKTSKPKTSDPSQMARITHHIAFEVGSVFTQHFEN
jgi:hypothetical protein